MKFEFKTENNNYSKSFSFVFRSFFILAHIIILYDIALKLGIISRHYQINNNCRILSVEKSKRYFRKLSRLSNLKSKQQIWGFCREVIE